MNVAPQRRKNGLLEIVFLMSLKKCFILDTRSLRDSLDSPSKCVWSFSLQNKAGMIPITRQIPPTPKDKFRTPDGALGNNSGRQIRYQNQGAIIQAICPIIWESAIKR